jgi:hypothetical protein
MKLSRTLFRCLYYPTIHARKAIQPYQDLPATDRNRRFSQIDSRTSQFSPTTHQRRDRHNPKYAVGISPTTASGSGVAL